MEAGETRETEKTAVFYCRVYAVFTTALPSNGSEATLTERKTLLSSTVA
jgi:hypothetical protein